MTSTSALEQAVAVANAGQPKLIDVATLRQAVLTGDVPLGWRAHIREFVDQADVLVLLAVVHQIRREDEKAVDTTWMRLRTLAETVACRRWIWDGFEHPWVDHPTVCVVATPEPIKVSSWEVSTI